MAEVDLAGPPSIRPRDTPHENLLLIYYDVLSTNDP